jgi:uncharacterized membrane protein
VNVGGAVIPTLMSAYLVLRYQLWPRAAIAVAVIACEQAPNIDPFTAQ